MNLRTTFGITMMVLGTNCNILSYGSENENLIVLGLLLLFVGSSSLSANIFGTGIKK